MYFMELNGKETIRCDMCGISLDSDGGYMPNENTHLCEECGCSCMQEFRVCIVCGKPMTGGMTDLDSFYCHEECFEDAMDMWFPGAWRAAEDDGCGGYYEWYDARDCDWCGTGIFYTEWE